MNLRPGTPSPTFNLKDKNGISHKLDTVKSKYTVVYFYPKDDTPGCTIEAKSFSEALPKFKKAGATVIGISGGDTKTKAKFCSKYKLNLTLVSDSDYKVSKRYGAYGKKSFMGRTYTGVLRKTFILDDKKRVLKVYDSVTPEGHANEVLSYLSGAGKTKSTGATTAAGKAKVATKPGKTKKSPAVKKSAPGKSAPKRKAAKKSKATAKKTVVKKVASKKTKRTTTKRKK